MGVRGGTLCTPLLECGKLRRIDPWVCLLFKSGSGSDSGTIEHPRYLTEPRGKDGGKKKKKKRSASSSNAGIEGTPHLQRRLGQSISEDEL